MGRVRRDHIHRVEHELFFDVAHFAIRRLGRRTVEDHRGTRRQRRRRRLAVLAHAHRLFVAQLRDGTRERRALATHELTAGAAVVATTRPDRKAFAATQARIARFVRHPAWLLLLAAARHCAIVDRIAAGRAHRQMRRTCRNRNTHLWSNLWSLLMRLGGLFVALGVFAWRVSRRLTNNNKDTHTHTSAETKARGRRGRKLESECIRTRRSKPPQENKSRSRGRRRRRTFEERGMRSQTALSLPTVRSPTVPIPRLLACSPEREGSRSECPLSRTVRFSLSHAVHVSPADGNQKPVLFVLVNNNQHLAVRKSHLFLSILLSSDAVIRQTAPVAPKQTILYSLMSLGVRWR